MVDAHHPLSTNVNGDDSKNVGESIEICKPREVPSNVKEKKALFEKAYQRTASGVQGEKEPFDEMYGKPPHSEYEEKSPFEKLYETSSSDISGTEKPFKKLYEMRGAHREKTKMMFNGASDSDIIGAKSERLQFSERTHIQDASAFPESELLSEAHGVKEEPVSVAHKVLVEKSSVHGIEDHADKKQLFEKSGVQENKIYTEKPSSKGFVHGTAAPTTAEKPSTKGFVHETAVPAIAEKPSAKGFVHGAAAPAIAEKPSAKGFVHEAAVPTTAEKPSTKGFVHGAAVPTTAEKPSTKGFVHGSAAPTTAEKPSTKGFVHGAAAPTTAEKPSAKGFVHEAVSPTISDKPSADGLVRGAVISTVPEELAENNFVHEGVKPTLFEKPSAGKNISNHDGKGSFTEEGRKSEAEMDQGIHGAINSPSSVKENKRVDERTEKSQIVATPDRGDGVKDQTDTPEIQRIKDTIPAEQDSVIGLMGAEARPLTKAKERGATSPLVDASEVLSANGVGTPSGEAFMTISNDSVPLTNGAAPTIMTTQERIEQIRELVSQVAQEIRSMKSDGLTTTTMTISHPPLFEGSIVTLKEYDTAKGQYNIDFSNLTSDAKNVVDNIAHMSTLRKAMEEKGYTIHIFTSTTSSDTTDVVASNPFAGRDRDDDEERQGGRQQRQEQEQESDPEQE